MSEKDLIQTLREISKNHGNGSHFFMWAEDCIRVEADITPAHVRVLYEYFFGVENDKIQN